MVINFARLNPAKRNQRSKWKIPPPTPPAGGTGAEAGRIHIPSQMFRPAESALVFRVLRKIGSNFFKQTPPNLICRRSRLGASPLGKSEMVVLF